jgi:hypothetical protein
MWYIKHFGGMGNADKDLPKDIWPLEFDNENVKQMITSVEMAIELLKEF